MSLRATVDDLCTAVDGIDWDPGRTDALVKRMLHLSEAASPEELDGALSLIAARVRRSRIADADGVAHAAISGGTLIERGASPRPLAEALLDRLPDVLESARRFADRCLPEEPIEDSSTEIDSAGVVLEVDGLPITHPVFREHLSDDRGGGCSLAYLRQWALPTVAALTRDRETLARAQSDERLENAAKAMSRSDAEWIRFLLATQLLEPWLVLCVEADRGFELEVDQVASNFVLKALVADAVLEAGVPGERNPADAIEMMRGRVRHSEQGYVRGIFDHYTHWAAVAPSRCSS